MNWPTYKKQLGNHLKARIGARIKGQGGNFMITFNQLMTIRPNKLADLRSYQMAKSARYYKELFERKLPIVIDNIVHNIVQAAIEYAILSLIAEVANADQNTRIDSKLLMVYFEFFLAQSSFIYLANQQDPNVDQKFQNCLNLLENIRRAKENEIEAMLLADFNGTFNATITELLEEPQIRVIVHDNT